MEKRIDRIKIYDAITWLVQLQKNGRGYSTIRTNRSVLRPAFQMAADDNLIRKNPFRFEFCTVIYNDSVTREALSRENERKFLKFVREDSHFCRYYDGIYFLFNTGLRISEFAGLTISDIDSKNMKLNIDHQLQRHSKTGRTIEVTKSESGVRQTPMTVEVADCFKRIIKARGTLKIRTDD